jgi:hypothetical protein
MRPGRPGAQTQPAPPPTQSLPQSLQPPEGSKPSVHTTSHVLTAPAGGVTSSMAAPTVGPPGARGTVTGQIQPSGSATRPGVATYARPKKKKIGTQAKLVVSLILGAAALTVGLMVKKQSDDARKVQELKALIERFADPEPKDVNLTPKQVKDLLDSIKSETKHDLNYYTPAMRALRLGKTPNLDDMDSSIADVGVWTPLEGMEWWEDVRQLLFRDVVRRRPGHAGVAKLLGFARVAKSSGSAEAALDAVRDTATDVDFPAIMEIVQEAATPSVRKAAADDAKEVLRRSTARAPLLAIAETARQSAKTDEIKGLVLDIKLSVPAE